MWGTEVVEPEPLAATEKVCAGCNLVHNRFLAECPDCEMFATPQLSWLQGFLRGFNSAERLDRRKRLDAEKTRRAA